MEPSEKKQPPYIKNPPEAVQLIAVQRNGLVIQYIKEPSVEMQLAAVQQKRLAIEYVKNIEVFLCLKKNKTKITRKYVDEECMKELFAPRNSIKEDICEIELLF